MTLKAVRRSAPPIAPVHAVAIALAACLGLGSCAGVAQDDAATVDRLLLLMQRRLELAQDVARDKWNRTAPVEDVARERVVIEAAVAQAARNGGADPQRIRRFFRGQIEAGKTIQAALFTQWQAERRGKFADAPDLATGIRPELDRLTAALVPALDAAIPLLERPGAERVLQQRAAAIRSKVNDEAAGFDAAWRTAIESVQAVPY